MPGRDRADADRRSSAQARTFEHGASRRDVLRAGGTLAVAAGATGLPAGDAAAQRQPRDAEMLQRLVRAARDPRRRILLSGGTIITMDASVGDFARGDLL